LVGHEQRMNKCRSRPEYDELTKGMLERAGGGGSDVSR